ncbi:6-phosphogluconate dehydrogenase [Mycena vitilis]|nr:6-phosphogluconate dehydrogenase [Mycena vitilis]
MGAVLADVGFISVSMLSKNLMLNMNDKGLIVVAYVRNGWAVNRFLESEAKGTAILGAHSLAEFVSKLKTPRKIFLMVKAGLTVDGLISHFEPLLDPGDILIDLSNSLYLDTTRRTRDLEDKGLLFVGCGVGGGQDAVRTGPCLSAGGSPDAWPTIQHLLQSIDAYVDGRARCDWIAEGGAGHFVKMVQTGLLYSNMELIAEGYEVLRRIFHLNEDEIAGIFADWNHGILKPNDC